jgi:hypothetical protein
VGGKGKRRKGMEGEKGKVEGKGYRKWLSGWREMESKRDKEERNGWESGGRWG